MWLGENVREERLLMCWLLADLLLMNVFLKDLLLDLMMELKELIHQGRILRDGRDKRKRG